MLHTSPRILGDMISISRCVFTMHNAHFGNRFAKEFLPDRQTNHVRTVSWVVINVRVVEENSLAGGCVFDGVMQGDIKHILINAASALQLA